MPRLRPFDRPMVIDWWGATGLALMLGSALGVSSSIIWVAVQLG